MTAISLRPMLPRPLSSAKRRPVRNDKTVQTLSPRLPPEIFLIIIQHLPADDKATLRSVLLSCRTLHDITEELFYLTVTIPDKTTRSQNLFERLATRPDLGAKVHRLEWPKTGALPVGKPLFLRLRGAETQVKYLGSIPMTINALQGMRNIRKLVIGKLSSSSILDSMHLLVDAIGQMKLTTLSLTSRRWSWSNGIIPILRSQPELTSLRLPWQDKWIMRMDDILEPTAIPRLASLHCGPFTAAHIVPGRPIEKLLLRVSPRSWWEPEDLWDYLAEATKPITHLTFHIVEPKKVNLDWILQNAAARMACVEVLQLSPMIDDWALGEMKYDLEKMTTDMARFKMLRSYTVHNTIVTASQSSQTVGQRLHRTRDPSLDERLAKWKEACPGLTYVVVNDDSARRIAPGLRWERGQAPPWVLPSI
ncbi:hypothetical protein FRB94_008303 [Tulasnella sp. JGI-2019a]|nr:hypothetical protein FRB94_008303 [Tulasnella sp. JGI-2019a]